MFESLTHFNRRTHHAVTTIGGAPQPDAIARALQTAYDDRYDACRFSLADAPGGRGTEVHATSDDVGKDDLKDGLRKARALLEAGEIPTGARA